MPVLTDWELPLLDDEHRLSKPRPVAGQDQGVFGLFGQPHPHAVRCEDLDRRESSSGSIPYRKSRDASRRNLCSSRHREHAPGHGTILQPSGSCRCAAVLFSPLPYFLASTSLRARPGSRRHAAEGQGNQEDYAGLPGGICSLQLPRRKPEADRLRHGYLPQDRGSREEAARTCPTSPSTFSR